MSLFVSKIPPNNLAQDLQVGSISFVFGNFSCEHFPNTTVLECPLDAARL